MRPVIHSIKHYVQESITAVAAGAADHVFIINSLPVDQVDAVAEVVEGSVIKAVYVEFWVRGSATAAASGQVIVWKGSSDTSDPSTTDLAALGDWDNKKNILFTSMGLYNDVDADAIPVLRQWIKIPKSKQRFGLGDKLKLSILATGQGINHCGFFTYKEYS